MPGKTAGKTAKQKPDSSTIERIPQKNGSALLAGGVPGNAGGTGRPTNEFIEWCRGLLEKKKNKAQVEAVLGNAKHPAYATMWKEIKNTVHGKPKESREVEVSGRILVTNDILAEPTK